MTVGLKIAKSKTIWAALALCLHGVGLFAQGNQLSLSASTLQFAAADPDSVVPSQTVLVNATDGPLAYETAVRYMSPESGWLSATSGDTAPSKVVVRVDASNLTTGFYMGYVRLITAQSVTSITVTLKVGQPQGVQVIVTPLKDGDPVPATTVSGISVTPVGDLTFATTVGGPAISKSITITSSISEHFYLYVYGGGWLSRPLDDLPLPATVTFIADPTGFNFPQTQTNNIVVQGVTSNSIVQFKGIMTVSAGVAGGLTASPNQLGFSQIAGSPTPSAQTVTLSASSATAFTVSSSATWLSVSPTSGTTSATSGTSPNDKLTVTVDANALTPSATPYTGTITISAGSQSLAILVTFSYTSNVNPNLTALPTNLSFTQTIGTPPPPSKTVALTTTIATTFSASTTAPWLTLTIGQGPGTTSTLTVLASATGLSAGIQQANITVTAGTSTINIPVTFSVNTVAPTLTATPAAISLSQILRGSPSGAQIVVDALNPTTFTAFSDAPWLTVTPATTVTTPTTLTAFVNRDILAVGTYQANITLNGGTSPVTVPVTLTVTGATVTATPQALSFTQILTSPGPPSQTLRIDSAAAANFTVSSNANWLNVTPSNGVMPGTVTVSVNASTLALGAYQSSITVSTATTIFDVPVTLSVANLVLSVNTLPGSVSFTGAAGASGTSAPQPQSVAVSSSATNFTFTATASAVGGGNWLSVSPASGTTPSTLTVAVNINGLQQGQYTGAITITPNDPSISTRVLSVTMILTGSSPGTSGITVKSLVNAASMQPGPISPGEIITIFGTGLGSTNGASGALSAAGALGTSIGDTRVLFDGIPAPLTYARADQVNAIVPYGIYGRFATTMQVEVAGSKSEALQLRVDTAAPGVFTSNATGSGQGAVINQDGTVNSPASPAPRGSVISIYGTGEGQTRPPGQDGRIITTDLRTPVGVVGVKIAGGAVDVPYAGSAPGSVSGSFQVNVAIPDNTPVGGQIPLELSVAGIVSQVGVTVAVK